MKVTIYDLRFTIGRWLLLLASSYLLSPISQAVAQPVPPTTAFTRWVLGSSNQYQFQARAGLDTNAQGAVYNLGNSTNLPASSVTGTLTNNTTGNAGNITPGVAVNPANGRNLTNLLGVATNVYYLSQHAGVVGVFGAGATGIGADSGPGIQRVLDQATNGPIKVIWDAEYITAQTLYTYSGTTHEGLYKGAGPVLSNACNRLLMVNRNLNGNLCTDSNIAVRGMTFYGTGWSQERFMTTGNPFYTGVYSPITDNTADEVFTPGDSTEGGTHWRPWLWFVWFAGVNGLTIRDVEFNNSRTFALTLGGYVENAVVENVRCYWNTHIDANQDGIHTFTPLKNIDIRNIWSNGDDDTIALNTDELSYVTNASMRIWRGTNGGGSNIRIRDIWHDSETGGFVRILSYNQSLGNNGLTNVTIEGLHGRMLASSFITGPVNSWWLGANTFIDGLTIRDVEIENSPGGISLVGVSGTTLNIDNVVSYEQPSYYAGGGGNLLWAADRFSAAYIDLDHSWDSVSIQNCHFYAPSSATNVAMVDVRYPFGASGVKNLNIGNSSISGKNVRAVVANHGNIGTVTFTGVTTTNRNWIPGVYTAKTVSGGGTIAVGQTINSTNYAEDTPLWLRRVRQIGYEPHPQRVRAVDWGLQFFQSTGDLTNIHEIGFLAGATNINEVLPKIRTYYTNEWTTNGFQINSSFATDDLNRYGLVGDGASFLDTQVAITTNGIGAAWFTNLSVGVYLQTIATTNAARSYAGPSYTGGTDFDWFSFQSWSPATASTPTMLLGNFTYGPIGQLTNAGLHSFNTTSTTVRNIYVNGVLANTASSWNGRGLTNGTFLIGKGQFYSAATNEVISGWFVGNSSVNQSNITYGLRIMTEMAACYSPASIHATGWTNYFAGNASVLIKGGATVGITNQLGQTVDSLSTATNVTVTLKPGWILGGSGLSGVATDL